MKRSQDVLTDALNLAYVVVLGGGFVVCVALAAGKAVLA